MSVILFIVILFVLVLVHEFGHYIVAKRSGIRVDEFGFGYPPRAVKLFTKGGTLFTLNWLPFGGFVKIFGENPDDENTNGPDKDKSFVHKPKYIQALVLVAGVFMNFILAWLLLSLGYMSGSPTAVGSEPSGYTVENAALTVMSVEKNSPAEIGGLKIGDVIEKITYKNEVVTDPTPDTLRAFVQGHSNTEIDFSISRGPDKKEILVTPKIPDGSDKAVVGIAMDNVGTLKLPFFRSLIEGLKTAWNVTVAIVVNLYTLIHDAVFGHPDLSNITGPVGIVGVVGDAYRFGLSYLISLTALISLNLAVINLLPFPALDGGRLLFVGIESIKRSPINPKISNTLNFVGFSLLIILMLVLTYKDIMHLIK